MEKVLFLNDQSLVMFRFNWADFRVNLNLLVIVVVFSVTFIRLESIWSCSGSVFLVQQSKLLAKLTKRNI